MKEHELELEDQDSTASNAEDYHSKTDNDSAQLSRLGKKPVLTVPYAAYSLGKTSDANSHEFSGNLTSFLCWGLVVW